jgi:hypothetical protein
LFTLAHGRLRVATEGLAQGQTILDRKKIGYPQRGWGDDIPDAQVCMQVDAAAAGRVFETTLMGDWLAKA